MGSNLCFTPQTGFWFMYMDCICLCPSCICAVCNCRAPVQISEWFACIPDREALAARQTVWQVRSYHGMLTSPSYSLPHWWSEAFKVSEGNLQVLCVTVSLENHPSYDQNVRGCFQVLLVNLSVYVLVSASVFKTDCMKSLCIWERLHSLDSFHFHK